ncbi:rhamnulose-1-phosphate aldolase/alcohol dehydrogenase [Arboricoccus pini]|uniref:Rhamnulose-1-phosphate aldolase/alcohol dehydrogenase n=1 Tax=Arboricoccus pini TaxID=1963835 RepID=A0A212RXS1_9PROT|nr:bifunctional rhamnulose-1-phosphate aldolase/short-chain dehydrogenase [Arboricoccus pini]SNB77402.1 rhamnulose-1-phosphate aldolase/alcohol dehydrogenase [Arboricoccus pini]
MAEAQLLQNKWDDAKAASLRPEELLLYRSNLLGSDKRITNYGGGNTSSKIRMPDPLTGEEVTVLWVKGSGGDIGSMKLDGFSTLYMDKLLSLQKLYRGPEQEDPMVALYNHCTFNLNPRATSIDTPLHGLIDRPHVDHVHPDAVIAIAASADSKALTREIWGDEIGWVPWRRPGFELGLWLKRFVEENPRAKGCVLEAHGLFTWGDTQKECYETTIGTINKAIAWLGRQSEGKVIFGGERVAAASPEKRAAVAAGLMPAIRGLISKDKPKLGHFDDQPAVLEFVGSADLDRLAPLGTSCPDHFLRTKIRPLVLPFDPQKDEVADLIARLEPLVAGYREDYAAYYARCKHADSPAMRDPNPVVYLIPGIGMITFAGDRATARISAEFYVNAINVMRGADTVSTYRGLPEQEAFDIEYWLLEEAKLARLPRQKALAGKVALITGGAGGIGTATARRLMGEGACAVICDIDKEALAEAEAELAREFGKDVVRGLWVDVTKEEAVASLFAEAARAFGGLDICVSNAGIASAAPIEETTLALWQRNMDILSTGYFLISREAFRLMKAQGIGGSIVFVASKNALVASAGASAYCTAKASEVQLARCLALEGAPHQIRANVVNPDAVLRGSRIWKGEWGTARAASYKTDSDGLEEVYRERSLLKLSVYPEDIAEGIAFFASSISAKSTGNVLNVDAGHAPSFTR